MKLYDKPIQHGELILKPIAALPKGSVRTIDSFIGGFSRSGHHHVLRAKAMQVIETKEHNFVSVSTEGVITHSKIGEKHKDLRLPVGIYQLNIKKEYDIYADVIREVQD